MYKQNVNFCFRLRQSSFHWIKAIGVVDEMVRNGKVLILWTPCPRAYDSVYDSDFRSSLGYKLSYNSDFDSDASENKQFKKNSLMSISSQFQPPRNLSVCIVSPKQNMEERLLSYNFHESGFIGLMLGM